jgi:hypothetical protein
MVQFQGLYQKKSKKVLRFSTYEFSSMLKKLETKQTKKLFFTAVEIVPFEVDRN